MTVSDGVVTIQQNLTVCVTDVDEPPELYNLPGSVSVRELYAGQVYKVSASDPESSHLSFILTSKPASPLFSITSTGR